ncbi:N-acetylmuramoyl-L-alanine amidase, partial [Actinomadura adrarensis]
VTEVAGWKNRGREAQASVDGIVCHHTATPGTSGDYPSLVVVRDGYSGLPGPLSHFGIGRSGRIYVIAAGRCNHNAPSTSSYHTNSRSIGIEAENNGRSPWPAVQLDAYRRLCAELCKEFGLPASRVKAHREVNSSKPDPHSINMATFRADVARLMSAGGSSASGWMEEIVKDLPMLSQGAKADNEHVQTLRALLLARSHPEIGKVEGPFDAKVETAVRAVQRWGKVDDDGIVGPKTWPVLLRVHT